MLRRAIFAIGAFELAVGLTFACSSFSAADDPAVIPSGDAEDENADLRIDVVVPDAASDAATSRCGTFDAAAAVQPSTSLNDYPCGALMVSLLGNPQHCGWCGHACVDTPSCTNGVCDPLTLVTGPPSTSLELDRVDDADLYWVDQGRIPAALFKASTAQASDQSTATKLVEVDPAETVNTQVYGIAIGDQVYLHTYTRLLHAPLGGGPLTVFSTTSAGGSVTPLVASGGHLFQTSYEGTGTFIDFESTDAAVLSKQTNVGFAYDLATTPDGRYAFFIGRKAVDAGVVDGSATTRAALYRYTVATKALTSVAVFDAMDAPASALAADDDYVYFPEGGTGSILRFAVDAPPTTPLTVLSQGDGRMIRLITIDDKRVYWFSSKAPPDYFDWDLSSVDKCGGGDFKHVAKEAGHSFLPRGFLVHGPYLYWSSRNTIFRVSK